MRTIRTVVKTSLMVLAISSHSKPKRVFMKRVTPSG
ncbi:MAG: hypothetical protein OJF50_001848 [Nitrospira sp.]|nr:hypothetical protein [Nitrospira sp.]